MRLIYEHDLNTSVTYHGIPLLVPNHIEYITADDDGSVKGWECKPVYRPAFNVWDSHQCQPVLLAAVELDGMPSHATLYEVHPDGE